MYKNSKMNGCRCSGVAADYEQQEQGEQHEQPRGASPRAHDQLQQHKQHQQRHQQLHRQENY